MVDQRKDKRAPASLKVKYKSATVDQFIGQLATDVSRGGLFVKTKTPLALGALIKIELQLSDASPVIHGIGRVCWRRESASDATLIPGMGIKFIKLEADSRSVVERIVKNRGEGPSRFDQTQGAEIAPPSIAPPAGSGAPPPITAPPPPITVPPRPAEFAATPASAPRAVAATPALAPRAVAATPSSVSARAPLPAGGSSSARVPMPAPAPASAPLSVPKPAASKQSGRAVAGLFADSPLSRGSAEPMPEPRSRTSFFPAAASAIGGSAAKRANSARPNAGRSEQARQSGQFLATAFAEGGLAADTTAQARAAADAHVDEVDELFDEVVKTSEHPAPPPSAFARAPVSARPAQTSAERESVDDMFAELSEEEGLPASLRAPPPARARAPMSAASDAFDEERTTVRTSVDELLDGLEDEAAPSASDAGLEEAIREDALADAIDADNAAFETPSDRPMLHIPSNAPAAPPEVASAMQRTSSPLPILIALVLVAGAAFGLFYFYKQRTEADRLAAQRQTAEAAAVEKQPHPPAAPMVATTPPSAVAPGEAAPAAQAAEPQAARPQAAPSAAAEAARAAPSTAKPAADFSGNARVDVEVSSLPRGADISVDGKLVGTTPSRVTLIVDKPTEVKLTSSGFAAMTRSLVPTAGNEALRFKLEPLPYALVVRSTPPGAQLSSGERAAVSPAPLELGHLDGGVQVSIAKDGFQRMTRLVRLDEFTDQGGVMRAEIDVTLNPLPGGSSAVAPEPQRPRSRAAAPRQREAPPAPPPSEPETPPAAVVTPAAEPKPAEPQPVEAAPPATPKPEASAPAAAAPAPPTPPAPPSPP